MDSSGKIDESELIALIRMLNEADPKYAGNYNVGELALFVLPFFAECSADSSLSSPLSLFSPLVSPLPPLSHARSLSAFTENGEKIRFGRRRPGACLDQVKLFYLLGPSSFVSRHVLLFS